MRLEPATGDPRHLAPARVHEAEGAGRRIFAMLQVADLAGPVVWVMPAHQPEQPMLWGLPRGLAERLHLVRTRSEVDLLWATEEALRSPIVSAVISEPEKPLSLTAGRRLQLAAEAGRTLGLLLIRREQGSNAAETRWHCTPLATPAADSTLHRWSLIKNKKGTLGDWTLNWDGTTVAFHLASEARERCRASAPPL